MNQRKLKKSYNKYRFLFAAGGTGGHLFPAIAVAEKIKELKPESEFLFLGTSTKLESKIIPQLGFPFKTLWISGFARKLSIKNILFPIKLVVSMIHALFINMKFKPRVAVGAGAYVAGPALWGASVMGSKIVLLEQNSYPGITNRILEKRADKIFTSFEESSKYFRFKDRIINAGNPVRSKLKLIDKDEAKKQLGLNPEKKCLFVLGGSLGAATLNKTIAQNAEELTNRNIQLIWQTGKRAYGEYASFESENIRVYEFIEDIALCYSAADLIVARAGATTIAEVSALGLPVVFVPSPNVAANHQYKNAKVLFDQNACELIEDKNFANEFSGKVFDLIFDESRTNTMAENIKKLARPDAAENIAKSVIELAEIV